MSADWAPGDQAMCVKSFSGAKSLGPDGTPLAEGQLPRPPLVYEVRAVCTPADFPMWKIDDPAPAYLVLKGAGAHPASSRFVASFDCRHFRKLPPLPPEELDDAILLACDVVAPLPPVLEPV